VARQCFCGCGRKLRFTKARASSFGRSVADRTGELADAKDRVPEELAPVFADMVQLGGLLARRWEPVAHSERPIRLADRDDTDAFLQDAKRLLAFARLAPAAQREGGAPVEATEVKSWLVTEAQRFAGDQFAQKVDLWRERAARAREKLPPDASADEIMAQARAEAAEEG
jgi:hypothetical protein